jgi:phosphoribosyl-ATP pyrophosphohydrolase/phosphoribosyl-AMP cyclohydrolase
MEAIAYDERGLVPCVIQDWSTGEVLTLAYMNAEALERTRATGNCTSGAARAGSCGARGPPRATPRPCTACATTATPTPCSRSSSRPAPPATRGSARAFTAETWPRRRTRRCRGLDRTIAARAAEPPEGSYTAALLADPAKVGEKVAEEAEEVVRAAREESDERVAEEAADVLYHLAVLLRSRGLGLTDAEKVLLARRR